LSHPVFQYTAEVQFLMHSFPAARIRLRLLAAACLLPLHARSSDTMQPVGLDHPHLLVDGAWFVQRKARRVTINRHAQHIGLDSDAGISPVSLPYARTQAGVRLRFRSASPRIELAFEARPDGGRRGLQRGFALFANGVLVQEFDQLAFGFNAPRSGVNDYELVLPSYHAVDLIGLALAQAHSLLAHAPDERPVYAAMGDSITNGLGQQSGSHLGYAFLVSRALGWNLVNLGISGARTGPALAATLAGRKVDVVSIALGFNDWYWSASSLAERTRAYERLLDGVRKAQPDALIVAITPLATTAASEGARAPFSLSQLRTMQKECVEKRRKAGDRRMHVLDGEQISNGGMLIDGIHLHVDGAAAYAAVLGPMLARLARQHGIAATASESD
jgi:lysophospholipase L1-like esterase